MYRQLQWGAIVQAPTLISLSRALAPLTCSIAAEPRGRSACGRAISFKIFGIGSSIRLGNSPEGVAPVPVTQLIMLSILRVCFGASDLTCFISLSSLVLCKMRAHNLVIKCPSTYSWKLIFTLQIKLLAAKVPIRT